MAIGGMFSGAGTILVSRTLRYLLLRLAKWLGAHPIIGSVLVGTRCKSVLSSLCPAISKADSWKPSQVAAPYPFARRRTSSRTALIVHRPYLTGARGAEEKVI